MEFDRIKHIESVQIMAEEMLFLEWLNQFHPIAKVVGWYGIEHVTGWRP